MKNHIHPLSIELLSSVLIPKIVDAFHAANWNKPSTLFEHYLKEQTAGERLIWVALKDTEIAGYITLKWHSAYLPFQNQHVPEIMDFNVLPAFRKQGIGTALLTLAEKHAFMQHETLGLGAGLYADYGQAIQLYIKHGYKPDGQGVTYNYNAVQPGNTVCLDDDLVLWFTKKRTNPQKNTVVSIKNATHYVWGDICDGWWFHESPQYTVIYERMPPKTSEKKHYHHYTEQFFYCLRGTLTMEIRDTQYQLEPHTGIAIAPGVAHTALNLSDDTIEFLVFSIPNAHLDRIDLE